jgi:hypothetical protein
MSRTAAGALITAVLLACALICACAYGIAHDGTTPARPASTTSP